MTKFVVALKDSFKTLCKHPKLFLPKIFIAVLFSIPVLFLPSLTIASIESPSLALLEGLIFWIFFILGVSVVDILINAMYPFLIKDFFEKKEVSLKNALKLSLKKFFLIVPTILIVEFSFLAVVFVLGVFISLFIITSNTAGLLITGLITLALIFLLSIFFFMIYPVLSLERTGIFSSMKRSFFISKKNLGDISKATIVSVFLSIVSIVLSYAIELLGSQGIFIGSIVSLLLFIAVRFLTALFATYQYVLNPVFYLEIEKGETLS